MGNKLKMVLSNCVHLEVLYRYLFTLIFTEFFIPLLLNIYFVDNF